LYADSAEEHSAGVSRNSRVPAVLSNPTPCIELMRSSVPSRSTHNGRSSDALLSDRHSAVSSITRAMRPGHTVAMVQADPHAGFQARPATSSLSFITAPPLLSITSSMAHAGDHSVTAGGSPGMANASDHQLDPPGPAAAAHAGDRFSGQRRYYVN
jgi:hypothetical protein